MGSKKWSNCDAEGARMTRIIRRLTIKLDRMTSPKKNHDYDLEKAIDLTTKLALCIYRKAQIAEKTDFEQRLKYLEAWNGTRRYTAAQQKHEEFATV